MPRESDTKRLRINQGYRWHFFEVNSFSSKTILIEGSSPSNFGSPSGWPVGKDGPNIKYRSALRIVERLRTMIEIQESLAFNQGMRESPVAGFLLILLNFFLWNKICVEFFFAFSVGASCSLDHGRHLIPICLIN